jgi:alpha-ribazole phosphatase
LQPGICYGQTDVALAANLAQTIHLFQAKLANLPQETFIVTSPLQRCWQLATQLSLGSEVIIDNRLQELNFGAWEMQPWEAIPPEQLQWWLDDYVNRAPPQGESYQALLKRSQACWQSLLTILAPTVLVITHAGVIRALLAYLLGIPLRKSFSLQVNYNSITKVYYNHTTPWPMIEYINN